MSWLEELIGGPIETIHVVGGGSHNRQLCQATADACRRRVVAGPVEATAIGNLLMQAVAVGDIGFGGRRPRRSSATASGSTNSFPATATAGTKPTPASER